MRLLDLATMGYLTAGLALRALSDFVSEVLVTLNLELVCTGRGLTPAHLGDGSGKRGNVLLVAYGITTSPDVEISRENGRLIVHEVGEGSPGGSGVPIWSS